MCVYCCQAPSPFLVAMLPEREALNTRVWKDCIKPSALTHGNRVDPHWPKELSGIAGVKASPQRQHRMSAIFLFLP